MRNLNKVTLICQRSKASEFQGVSQTDVLGLAVAKLYLAAINKRNN